MSDIRFKELIDAYENYRTHANYAAKIAKMSSSAIEYNSYLKNLRRFISTALESNDAKLLLSTAIVLHILIIFLVTKTWYGLK